MIMIKSTNLREYKTFLSLPSLRGQRTIDQNLSTFNELPDEQTKMVNKPKSGATDFEKFTWTIEDFSKKNVMDLKSKAFEIRGCRWRLHVYPLRKDVDHFSLFMMVADNLPPYGWDRNTFFKLVLINQLDRNKSVVKETQQKFNGGHRSWGSIFLNLNDFKDRKQGYLVKDTCIIEAHICVSRYKPKNHDINSLNPINSTPTLDIHDSKLCDIATDQSSESGTARTSRSSPSEESHESESINLTLGEFIDLDSLKAEENEAIVPLLEEVCTWRPSLIHSQMKNTRSFKQWAFTSLGKVLYFLKTKKVKDIGEEDCKELRILWEELVKSSGFDLAWLEPYVEYALGVKGYVERSKKFKKLKDNVVALEIRMKKLRGELAAAEAQFDVERKCLIEVRKDFQEMNLNAPIGYNMF